MVPAWWNRLRAWRADRRRTMQAVKLWKRGRRLVDAGRHAEAIGPLTDAIALIGTPQETWLYGVQMLVRSYASFSLCQAMVAAGSPERAIASVRHAMVVLEELKQAVPDVVQKEPFYASWEAWARRYLQRS